MKKNTALFLTLLLPIQLIFIWVIKQYPAFIEHYYSNGIFPYLSRLERLGLGWIPFSIGDLLYSLFIIGIIRWVYLRFKTRFKKPVGFLLEALATFSLIYACFLFFWGLNYYRLPLYKALYIKDHYSKEQLIEFTKKLIEKANEQQLSLVPSDTMKVVFPFKKYEIRKMAMDGYDSLAKEYPTLRYEFRSVKPSLFSIPLTYMGFNGYLNPLTGEAQVNNQIPKFKLPSTTCHEIGHQLGFAKENEANFIACLATMNHPNPYFRYAGYTFALKYCLGDLYLKDPCETENLIGSINPGIIKNYHEVDRFWNEHENPLEPFFKVFYGGYLKANNQPQGIESYNYVVALLVNYFEGDLWEKE